MPSDKGVTSSSRTSFTSPERTPPWIARTERDGLIGIDVPAWLLAEEVLHFFLDLRHTGLAADEDDVVDLVDLQAGIVQRNLARTDRTLNERVHERLELGARQLDVEVLRTAGIGRDVRQVHLGLLLRRLSSILAFSAASLRRCMAAGPAEMSTPLSR